MRRVLGVCLALALAGCDDGGGAASAEADGGVEDASHPDMSPSDVGEPDGDLADAGALDAGSGGEAVINEVRCADPEWVELRVTDGALYGWRLSVDGVELPLDGVAPGHPVIEAPPAPIQCGQSHIALLGPDGEVVDEVEATLPAEILTRGRLPDGVGAFVDTEPTPGQANQAPELPAAAWFGPGAPLEVALTLAPGSERAMDYNSGLTVDGALSIDGSTAAPARVRLVGWGGRARRIGDRPQLSVEFVDDLEGLSGIRLDNLTLDRSLVARPLAYRALDAFGVPHPRLRFVRLTVDGAPRGLFLMSELHRASLLQRILPSTGHLYSTVGRALTAGAVDLFSVVIGPSGDRRDLLSVVEVMDAAGRDLYSATAAFIDWDQVIPALAAEVYLGSVDGHGPRRRASYYHLDEAARLRLLLTGLDAALVTAVPVHQGVGRLLTGCLSAPDCRARYDAALAEGAAELAAVDWAAEVDQWLGPISEAVEADPSLPTDLAGIRRAAEDRVAFLEGRQAEIAALVECLATDQDEDGDGHICDEDCDPSRADRYVGAESVCGDGVDQDCSGVADDNAACGGCALMVTDERTYRVCGVGATWAQGEARCRAAGMALAVVKNQAELRPLLVSLRSYVDGEVWVGLSDQETEGEFVAAAGITPVVIPWAVDQPDDAGEGEDCVALNLDGRHVDLSCFAERAVLCADPCEAEVDADGDGVTVCGGDCDDGDPARAPGLLDVCGDGVDQDCSGVADDDVCGCVAVSREGETYWICTERMTYADAEAQCAALGATLATPADAEISGWLWRQATMLASQSYWLGVSDREVEGAFVDPAGARLTYAPWSAGEPNDYGDDEDCGHFWSTAPQWNDASCRSELGVICGPALIP